MTDSAVRKPRVGVADPEDVLRRGRIAVGGGLTDLEPLPGGASSITYSARLADGRRVVVKVAPPGLEPVRNRDVLRQARLLAALTDVPAVAVPAVLGTEPGAPPEVPPLFVMTFAEGESYEPRHSTGPHPDPEEVRARGTAAATMLAALHAVSPAELGVDEPDTGPQQEIGRWRKAFGTCTIAPDQQAAEARCADLLAGNVPAPVRPAVLHGDWRLGNMQCQGPEIRAVIDWEIWSVGDPRMDLAWMRLMHDPAHPTATSPEVPSLQPDEVLAAYEAAAGPVADLRFFDALVRYKQAAVSALLVKNAEKRGEDSPRIDRMRRGIGLLLDAALDRLA